VRSEVRRYVGETASETVNVIDRSKGIARERVRERERE
jgi:hypothetical protein